MLQCVKCGLHATVDDPSKEEWSAAYHAPSKPYRWHDETRVVVHQELPTDRRYVQKKPPSAKKCKCYAKLGVPEPGVYERVWIEATRPKPEVTAEARKELLDLAALADGADDLCTTFFPLFVEGYQQATGGESSYAVRWFAKQIEKLRTMGVHCSSSVIATLLRKLDHVREAVDASSDKDKTRRHVWAENIVYAAWITMQEQLSNPPVLEDEMLVLRKQLDGMIRQGKRQGRKKAT
jgi:hypothetical protein